MNLNPTYKTNEGRKMILAHDADGKPYIKIISVFGIATAYDMSGILCGRWEATREERDEYEAEESYQETQEPTAQPEGKKFDEYQEKYILRLGAKIDGEKIIMTKETARNAAKKLPDYMLYRPNGKSYLLIPGCILYPVTIE